MTATQGTFPLQVLKQSFPVNKKQIEISLSGLPSYLYQKLHPGAYNPRTIGSRSQQVPLQLKPSITTRLWLIVYSKPSSTSTSSSWSHGLEQALIMASCLLVFPSYLSQRLGKAPSPTSFWSSEQAHRGTFPPLLSLPILPKQAILSRGNNLVTCPILPSVSYPN